MSDKLVLQLDELNDLGFTMHVQGMSTEPDAAKPIFRFVIFEKGKENKNGYMYAANKDENEEGKVIVSIFPTKGQYTENKEYIGKMEVILGSRYFVTTTLDIVFERPFAIKTELVKKEQKSDFSVKLESVNKVQNNISELNSSAPHPQNQEKPKQKESTVITIDDLDDLDDISNVINAPKESKPHADELQKHKLISNSHEKKSSLVPDENGMVEISKSQLVKLMEMKKKSKDKKDIKSIIKDALK